MAQLATVTSVLLALALVIVGIQLNREYEISDLSTSLKSLSQVVEEPHFLARMHNSWLARARVAFRVALRTSSVDSFLLRDKEEGFPYFTTRFYWDGVWFRLADSPLEEVLSADDQRAAAAHLHEVLICALEVLSCYVAMRERSLFISTEESGTNGCRWCHKAVREFLESHPALKDPVLVRSMTIEEARAVINLVIQVCFLAEYEVKDHKEEYFSNPLKSSEFSTFACHLLIWIAHFKGKYDTLRYAMVRQRLRSNEEAEMIWDTLVSTERMKEMHETKANLLELNDSCRSGNATRLRTARLFVAGSITVFFSTLFLIIYALGTPFLHLQDSSVLSALLPLSFFVGIASILSSGIFVFELLVGREVK